MDRIWRASPIPLCSSRLPVRRRIRRLHLHVRGRSRAHGLLARELSPSLRDLCNGPSRQLPGVCWIRSLRLRPTGSMCRTVGSSPEAELCQNHQVYRRKRLGPGDFDDWEAPFRTQAANQRGRDLKCFSYLD